MLGPCPVGFYSPEPDFSALLGGAVVEPGLWNKPHLLNPYLGFPILICPPGIQISVQPKPPIVFPGPASPPTSLLALAAGTPGEMGLQIPL